MEFLVRAEFRGHRPHDIPPEAIALERLYGRELLKQGALRRIWRVPGSTNHWALYAARDASALHGLLEGLPLFAHLELTVEPLAVHPLEESPEGFQEVQP
jgi:muconolactone D-isomerase